MMGSRGDEGCDGDGEFERRMEQVVGEVYKPNEGRLGRLFEVDVEYGIVHHRRRLVVYQIMRLEEEIQDT